MTKIRFLALLVLLILAGCKESPPRAVHAPQGEFTAVATTGMVADIVRRVAGDEVYVHGIIGEGVDPHLYKPTRTDVAALSSADIVFYSGLHLEGKMSYVFSRLAEHKPVIAVTSGIEESYLLSPPDFSGNPDPHIWMDVRGWMQAVREAERGLAGFDKTNAARYRRNSEKYLRELEALDAYCRESVATIPAGSRVLVTAHDAFNYLGRAYGLEVMGIQGISTDSEAGLVDLNRLVDTIVKRKIKAVFVETSVADKNVKALIEGAKSKGFDLAVGGELYSDAMGPPGTYEGTYVGMIDHNITVIVRALGGQAPPLGLNGKLKPLP